MEFHYSTGISHADFQGRLMLTCFSLIFYLINHDTIFFVYILFSYLFINIFSSLIIAGLVCGLECSPKAQKSWVQSQVESYQRLKKMVLDASLPNTLHYKGTDQG